MTIYKTVANQKFELTNIHYNHYGIPLRRIRALRAFGGVKAGDLGGYVQFEHNLSHEGLCWIYDSAFVYQDAQILDSAQARGNVWIHNRAKISEQAVVTDSAIVQMDVCCFGNCVISKEAFLTTSCRIYENCVVTDRASIGGKAWCHGNAKIYGFGKVFGEAEVDGSVKVRGSAKLWAGHYSHGCYDFWSAHQEALKPQG